jgi:hypothetical protein
VPAKGLPNPNAGAGTRFEKGKSGNPSGQSKERRAANKALAEVLKTHEPKAIQTLVDLLDCEVPSVRLRAAEIIFDRVHGKAVQRVGGENDGEPVVVYLKDYVLPEEGFWDWKGRRVKDEEWINSDAPMKRIGATSDAP